uniref:C-type lectin domain-containing protein n=1 Tax=Echeneis naucrates TaxID=173247 RepID=A0A665TEY4_ECHNA
MMQVDRSTDCGTQEPGCPESWLMFSSSCYYISSQRRSWHDSRQDCLQRGADLVIINNRQEQNFLIGFSMVAWIGMTDREMEGTWIWVDGTPVNRDGILWARGQVSLSLSRSLFRKPVHLSLSISAESFKPVLENCYNSKRSEL